MNFADFILQPGIQISQIRVDTKRCPKDGKDVCSHGIACSLSNKCIVPEQLCDDVNDCGDWSAV